jgi:putative tryptophan/tyrosine transport system substrate-binding protein
MLLAVSFAAEAQEPKRVYRIGWIDIDGSGPRRAFVTELRERGYVEGQSIIIEYRSVQGREEQLSQIANELIGLKSDVIVAESNTATEAAKEATKSIPIVFVHGDPIWDGVVGSLAQPEKNLIGVSTLSFELAGKRFELLRDAFPKVSRVAVLLHANASHRRQFADMQKVAKALGVQLQALEYHDLMLDFDSLFQRAISERVDALLTLQNPIVFRHRTCVVDLAAKNRLPAMYPSSVFAEAGGLISYGPNRDHLYRRAAYYVDRILKGAKPADLPVEQATKFELVINLKAANGIGVTIPPDVLMWADRIIK